MNQQNTEADQPGHEVGPEIDDSGNPTAATPEQDQQPRPAAGREMLVQLQQMIDTLATQAGPVMRDVAAKAAELAAVAGERAGPLAHRAAGMTENVGQRVAARSKVMAAELRRPKPEAGGPAAEAGEPAAEQPDTAGWPAEPPVNSDD